MGLASLSVRRPCRSLMPTEGKFAVQVSFDSSEPLADVLSVVESVYGVKLAVAGDEPASAVSSPVVAAGVASKPAGRRSKGSPVKPAASGPGRQAQRVDSTSAARDAGLAQRVRAWARDNGVEVSGRGRLPQSTLDAYFAAQS